MNFGLIRVKSRIANLKQEKGNHGDTEARRGIATNYTNCHGFFFIISVN